jgi:hypothetical protein
MIGTDSHTVNAGFKATSELGRAGDANVRDGIKFPVR